MRIVTSSWFVALPDDIIRIGISRGTPRGQQGYKMYRALAPGPWFRSVDYDTYQKRYFGMLAQRDAADVVSDLERLTDGRDAALLCFEPAQPGPAWCHRALVSVWLYERCGLAVYEYGLEDEGFGWRHPKLPPEVRVSSSTR
ncbi:hypothetical protein [Dichotomicrobium thermohalophilum]|uniref:Uncharacterized protein YeaO (DUF488 family) n=1 Tax=Dichotomicrobium thermohalophilum TaxID=933063 RepID=A0A397QFM5_9HYPH|nr:hypothetical protein [Dichotomicrobium thermohalophilum]RIA56854.1 uncharacterized protein YeaO (DUF488 family) [Dichotomicrobium thermohalophilum]